MRIAYLSTFYPFRGGIAQFNANLYEALGRQGHEVRAFTFTCQYPSFLFPGKTQYVTEQDRAKVVDSTALLNTANPFTYFSTARRIAAWKPDVVIMKYWMSYLAPSLGMVAHLLRRKGVKVVTVLDNVIPHETKFFDKPFSKWFLKQNDLCVAMSDSVLADMLSLAPQVPHILQPHPLYDHFGTKMERAQAQAQLGLDPQKRTLLYFGLIRDYKGLDLLIDAFGKLSDEYQLVIAGESYGPFDRYEQQIAASPACGRIKAFNRYIGDEEVPVFFSAADVCVLPYRSATQSGITAISLHFGLPLIATPVGGLPQSIGGAGIGLMTADIPADAPGGPAPAVSPEAIAAAIDDYFSTPADKYIKAISDFKKTATWDNLGKAIINEIQ